MRKGNIKVSEHGLAVSIGLLAGLLTAVPLIWLSRKIPQKIFADMLLSDRQERYDPALQGLHWQDLLLVFFLCLCAVAVAMRDGVALSALAGFFYCAVLLLLARIDARTRLLPDMLTLPLLWFGLLWHAAELGEQTLEQAVWGAAAGYIVLWLPCVLLGRWLGRELMGHGDFKLSAAMGAWLGCFALPFVWLIASCSSLLIAVLANRLLGRRLREPMAFGPSLALGGILMLLFDGF
jgi:prepilin signal peptidase PulO-like enzyme (type II secretory pathway)